LRIFIEFLLFFLLTKRKNTKNCSSRKKWGDDQCEEEENAVRRIKIQRQISSRCWKKSEMRRFRFTIKQQNSVTHSCNTHSIRTRWNRYFVDQTAIV